MRAGAVGLFPLLLLFVAEIALRCGNNIGYPTQFLIPSSDSKYATDNSRFAWQFFGRKTNLKPNPLLVPIQKEANSLRIVLLGESAAEGTPDPSFGFGRILESMLRQQYPGHPIEVINAAMRGINSHVILPIARDCAQLKPDLYIIYAGNNEVIGLYAPGSKSGGMTGHLQLLRLAQWIKTTRLAQSLEPAISKWRHVDGHDEIQGQDMNFFRSHRLALDDLRREAVYDNFKRNLSDTCREALQSGAKVVLSTVAVNLQDSPPFASLHRKDLSSNALAEWEQVYGKGVAAETENRTDEAIECYRKALSLDDHFADLHFRIARCFFAAGQYESAYAHFTLARDWDALQFRADRRINETIRQVAAGFQGQPLDLMDAEREIETTPLCPHRIPGEAIFREHVHFQFEGDYAMAKSLFHSVTNSLKDKLGKNSNKPFPSEVDCSVALAYTPLNEIQLQASIVSLTEQPPFLDQLEHDKRQAQAQGRLKASLCRLGKSDRDGTLAVYRAAISLNSKDWQIHRNLARLYQSMLDPSGTVSEFAQAVQLMPHDPLLRLDYAKALTNAGKNRDAIEQLQTILKIDPDCKPALQAMAMLHPR